MLRKIAGIGLYFILSVATAAESAVLVPDINAGRQKSEPCVVCHGPDGNSVVPAWPKIAGQPERYLVEQLKEYRKGEKGTRFNAVMYGLVGTLTDQDIVDLAGYFASQQRTPGVTDEKWMSLGEKIYRGGNPKTGVPACQGCHDPAGRGNPPAGFPPLSGQQSAYAVDQLKAFKNGARLNDPNEIMRDISQRMTDEEIEAVGNYVSGLH